MANRWGKSRNHDRFYFLWLKNQCRKWLQPWNSKTLTPWKETYDKARQHIQKQRHHFANKGLCSQSYVFSSSHKRIWQLDHKEGWASKNLCFQIVVLEKTLESLLDCKEIKPGNPKGSQPGVFIGRTDAEAPVVWPPDVKSWLIGKEPDAGKDWGQEEGGNREWDGWMASSTQWTWTWANSGREWRTGKPSILQAMVSQRFRYNWAIEQQESQSSKFLSQGLTGG